MTAPGLRFTVTSSHCDRAKTEILVFLKAHPVEKGKAKKEFIKNDRKKMIRLAGILSSYNEGDIGPGHCDKDGNSAPS